MIITGTTTEKIVTEEKFKWFQYQLPGYYFFVNQRPGQNWERKLLNMLLFITETNYRRI